VRRLPTTDRIAHLFLLIFAYWVLQPEASVEEVGLGSYTSNGRRPNESAAVFLLQRFWWGISWAASSGLLLGSVPAISPAGTKSIFRFASDARASLATHRDTEESQGHDRTSRGFGNGGPWCKCQICAGCGRQQSESDNLVLGNVHR
jgi:hypothetical protein